MKEVKPWLLALGLFIVLSIGTAVAIALIANSLSGDSTFEGQIIDTVIADEGDTCMKMFHATVESCMKNNIDPARKAKAGEIWYLVLVPDEKQANKLVILPENRKFGQKK